MFLEAFNTFFFTMSAAGNKQRSAHLRSPKQGSIRAARQRQAVLRAATRAARASRGAMAAQAPHRPPKEPAPAASHSAPALKALARSTNGTPSAFPCAATAPGGASASRLLSTEQL